MHFNEKIYQEYLLELQALEIFRTSHSSLHYDTPIEQMEDPDIKRLIEAIAFFSAHTRLHGIHTITQTHERIFRQYFPYLLHTLPAMTLIQIKPSLRLTEKILIPKGTEFLFKTPEKKEATFQTLEDTTLMPLFYEKFEFKALDDEKKVIRLHFESVHSLLENLKEIKLFINHLGSFSTASQALYTLYHALERLLVFYDDEKEGTLGSIFFEEKKEERLFKHPIEHLRSLLHLPEQELFLRIKLPVRNKKWKSMTLCFELNKNWPKMLELTKDAFVPYVVPVVNLKKAQADLIRCNGTKDSYPILYPNPDLQFKLFNVLSVSEVLSNGSRPLRPGILGQRENSYEIDFINQSISLDIPDSFINTKTVAINALWSQPWFSEHVNEEINIEFAKEFAPGINVQILGDIRPQENLQFDKDPHILLKILALKNQNHLCMEEILLLCNMLKQLHHSKFKKVPDLIRSAKVDQQLDKSGVGLSMQYTFELKELDDQNWVTVIIFFRQLGAFLNYWLSNFQVDIKVIFPQKKTPLLLKGEKQNELQVLARDFFLH